MKPEMKPERITGAVAATPAIEVEVQRALMPRALIPRGLPYAASGGWVRCVVVTFEAPDGSREPWSLDAEGALRLARLLRKHAGIVIRKQREDEEE